MAITIKENDGGGPFEKEFGRVPYPPKGQIEGFGVIVSEIVSGQLTPTKETPTALGDTTKIHSVIIQAGKDNDGSVFVGGSSGQHLDLAPGESVRINAPTLNAVWIMTTADNDVINYLYERRA